VILQKDLVKGYLRTKLLQRLRYILEVLRPHRPVADHVLRIITRTCRHSLQAASEVFNCPRLLDAILELHIAIENPSSFAFDLLMTVCMAGRHMAKDLVVKYRLMNIIIRHVTVTPSSQAAQDLYTSCFLLWRVLLSYGIGDKELRLSD
jgi:hypothetical protein